MTPSLLCTQHRSAPGKSPKLSLGGTTVVALETVLTLLYQGWLSKCSFILTAALLGSFSLHIWVTLTLNSLYPQIWVFLGATILLQQLVLTFPTLDLVPGSFLHFLWQWPQTTLKSLTDPLSSNSSLLWPAPLAYYTLKGYWVSQLKRYVTVLTHGC